MVQNTSIVRAHSNDVRFVGSIRGGQIGSNADFE
jgi:hypothetical protein